MEPDLTTRSPELEMAHVLFVDMVGWSRLLIDEQTRHLSALHDIIRQSAEVRRAEAGRQLIRLATGDGAALVFFGGPEAPARCALEIAAELRNRPEIQLRMGVHTGAVYRMKDVNAGETVAGDGINMAQRVMDCGTSGQILVSGSAAEALARLTFWRPLLHDAGQREVKHGVRLRVFDLRPPAPDGTVLSADTSQARSTPPVPARGTRLAEVSPAPASALPGARKLYRVALLYKRHVQPDERLLLTLEAALREQGCQVFIDRHLSIGVEWAREIERQVQEADAVIPLLSVASIQSEMLAYEVQIADDAAAAQNGRPRLLPVRVGYTGPLPEPLDAILDPLHYALWESPGDDPLLIAELLRAMADPPEVPAHCTLPPPEAEQPSLLLEAYGGAVPLDSPYYIARAVDAEFLQAIRGRESLVLVKGARQMGKTSLLARGLQHARERGARTILTDFQKLTTADLETAESLFLTLAEWIADQLDLEVLPREVWNPNRSSSINFERYVRREALEKIPEAVVWGLDEVDRLFSCSFGSDVFGLFRSWHNERSLNPSRPWSRLTLAIAYATEAHLFITDVNQSPFNVGIRLALEDFTFEQVEELNERHGAPLGRPELARFFRLVSGHPYLVRRGLHEIVSQGLDIAGFEARADRNEGPFGDHLRRILVSLSRDAVLCDTVRKMLQGRPCPDMDTFYRLRSGGIIAGNTPQDARPRCQIYATYLERHLL